MNYYLDTNIFLYAADPQSEFHAVAAKVLEFVVEGKITGVTSTETFQEIIYVGQRGKRLKEALHIFDQAFTLLDVVLPIAHAELARFRVLAESYPMLEGRDLLHAAAAISAGVMQLISYDTDFDRIKEIQRVTPEVLIAVVEG
ncbi:type II toxin-antitoxin system VapC family toxin [Candidatus Uhrbacteria bacterium]|nr:type II toxin-antitoxin system VapC family toxin [Candidatus Uhrbacteria bacterium]